MQHSIPREELETIIQEAISECNQLGIVGKDVTPFLLRRVADATKGRSLETNIALVQDNARVAAEIAVALSSLENTPSVQPQIVKPRVPVKDTEDSNSDIIVFGSMAVDLTCTLPTVSATSIHLHTSHPAIMHPSVGGVAHNVALAASYMSPCSVRLITALGSDPEGVWLREYAQNLGLDIQFVSATGSAGTARYVALHDKQGELVVAAADMRIIEHLKDEDIQKELQSGKPKFVAFDGNISPSSVKTILEGCHSETKGSLIQIRC